MVNMYISKESHESRQQGRPHLVWETPSEGFYPVFIPESELERANSDTNIAGERYYFLATL